MPELPDHGQWGMFLRNHDELSLDRLSDEERDLCFRQFAPDENMRIFERGIRRRLAPIMGGDRRKILLAYSILLSLPGTPVFWYGEEIGMGDDLNLPERFSVRTPMQWSSEVNGGFSTAPPEKLIRPVITGGDYGFERVNVERQEREPGSLLNALQQMIRVRQHHPQFGCGSWGLLRTDKAQAVLAHCCEWEGERIAAAHNFSEHPMEVTLETGTIQRGVASDALGNDERAIKDGRCRFELEPFGYRWIRLRES